MIIFFQIETKYYKKSQEFTNQEDYEARAVLRRSMKIFARRTFILSLTKGKRKLTHLKLPQTTPTAVTKQQLASSNHSRWKEEKQREIRIADMDLLSIDRVGGLYSKELEEDKQ